MQYAYMVFRIYIVYICGQRIHYYNIEEIFSKKNGNERLQACVPNVEEEKNSNSSNKKTERSK